MVNHILTVRGRKASVTPRTLVQGTVGQDTLTLDLDSEWNGLNVTVTFVAATTEITPELTANVCEIPHEVLVDSGEVEVFVLGTRDGKAMRHASLAHKMVVKKSNMSDGSTSADPSISAYRQAYDDAVKATEAANSAAGAAGSTAATMDALNKRYAIQISQQATDFSIAQSQRSNAFDEAMQGFNDTFAESEKLRDDAETKRDGAEKKRNKAEEKRAQDSKTRLEELAQAKTNADTATGEANTARDEAKKAADDATAAAGKATGAAGLADTAKTNANTAAGEARSAATKAETAARKADGAAETAGTAAGTAEGAAKKADTAAGKADSMAEKADASAKKADIATGKANEAAVAATNAATKANEVESKLTGNILKGKAKDAFIHVDDAFPSSLLGVEIEGATEQVTTTGKNLLDCHKLAEILSEYYAVEKGNIKAIKSCNLAWSNVPALITLDAGTYYSSGDKTLEIRKASDNSTLLYGEGKFTLNQTTEIKIKAGTGLPSYPVVIKAQIEKGSTATAYETYTGGKPSPSHEYPQEISNISKAELKVAGKNLAGVDESDNVNFILRKEPLPAGTYTFSCDKGRGSSFYFNIRPLDGSGKIVENDIVSNATSPCTITLSEPTGLYVNGWGLTAPYSIDSIQLEAGSKATDFEPISKPKATQIDLKGNELCSLVENLRWNPKTFKDELVIDSGGNVSLIKRVFSARIDGSERVRAGNTDKFQYFSYQPKTVLPLDGSSAIRSNRFGKVDKKPWSFYVAGGNNAAFFFAFPLGTFANDNELNEWLSKNPIDVNYLGAETKTIPLGKIELPALPESNSNVWTDAEITPRTTIEYAKDVNIAIARIEDAIASIG